MANINAIFGDCQGYLLIMSWIRRHLGFPERNSDFQEGNSHAMGTGIWHCRASEVSDAVARRDDPGEAFQASLESFLAGTGKLCLCTSIPTNTFLPLAKTLPTS